MQSSSKSSVTVVSDIRSDGSYIRSLGEYVRDFIISDGGSYDFANLWNAFGDEVEVSTSDLWTVIVPTQQVLEKSHRNGRLDLTTLRLDGNASKTTRLRSIFTMSVGSVNVEPDHAGSRRLYIRNKLSHPIELEMDATGVQPVKVVDISNGSTLNIVKFARREYEGQGIYFIYISGILSLMRDDLLVTMNLSSLELISLKLVIQVSCSGPKSYSFVAHLLPFNP
jgi:hypothetical protein